MIALSQTDVIEQAAWMAVLEKRTKDTVGAVSVENPNQLLAHTSLRQ